MGWNGERGLVESCYSFFPLSVDKAMECVLGCAHPVCAKWSTP